MLRFLYYFVIIYLLYRFVFNFLIPVISTTFKVKRHFNQAKQQMKDQMNHEYARQNHASQSNASGHQNSSAQTDKFRDDYIDFEEVK